MMHFAAQAESLPRHVEQLSLRSMIPLLVVCLLVFPVLLAIYRNSVHPLAKYPGPKLAAASYWYEYYYDVTMKGRYIWKIMDLHEQYGSYKDYTQMV